MLNSFFGILDEKDLPLKHQIARTILAGIASVVVGTLVEKAYDVKVKPTKLK